MRLVEGMEADHRVTVPTLIVHGQRQLQRRAPIALDDDAGPRLEDGLQRVRELTAQVARAAIWRVEEHEIVMTIVRACLLEERAGALTAHLGAQADALQVATDRLDGRRRGVDQGRFAGPARERLDR